jgi:importin subunit alpha-6/7
MQKLLYSHRWALTNIGSTDYTHLIVEHNAIVPLVRCLGNADADVREQAAWCLGNVAGDSSDLRDVVLNSGAMNLLLQNLAQPHNISLLRNCTWALSNFCRGKKPEPPLSIVAPALPALAHLVMNSNDNETMVDATWALSYISDGANERIQAVIEQPGLLEMLVKMCTSDNASLIVPALRVLGNCVSGDDTQTQAVLNAGGLNICNCLLEHTKKNIRKETCWMLSNVAAGTTEQLSQLMQNPSVLTQVLKQMGHGFEWDVRKEAAYVVSNIATAGNSDYTAMLIQLGAVQSICSILGHSDAKILTVALEALEYFLMVGNARADIDVFALMDEVDGIDKLEELQEHEDVAIYEKSVHLLETYFEAGEDADENIAPVTTEGSNQFSFGLNTPATGDSKIDFGNAFVAKQTQPAGAFAAFSQQSGGFGAPSSQFNFSM